MSRRLIVKPAAEFDIADGFQWYQERQLGLGFRFVEQLDAVFQRVVENPASYQEVMPEVRKAVVRRFPYLVFFTFDPEAVHILAVIPAAQDPDYINSRLKAET